MSYIDLDGLEETFPPSFFEKFSRDLAKETVLKSQTPKKSNTSQKPAVADASNRENPNQAKAASVYNELNKPKSYWETKMPGVSQSQKDPGSISPAVSNLEKWAGVMIAPETENMIKYDPFIKAISTGGFAVTAAPLGISTEFWLGKAAISAGSQALIN
mgnify:CR=1 FL=1